MGKILRLELLVLWRNTGVWLLVAGLGGLMVFGLYQGRQRVSQQKTMIAQIEAQEAAFYEEKKQQLDSIERGLRPPVEAWYQDPGNPLPLGAFGDAGTYAIQPPAPLAALSTGQSDIFPFYTRVNIRSENAGLDNDNLENPFHTVLGAFDLAFVLIFLLPLLSISLTYNILSAEHEQGTLPLVLSMPMSLGGWLGRKIALRFLLLWGLSSLLLYLSLIINALPWWRVEVLYLGLATGLYLLFWNGLALLVNWWGKSSDRNALYLLGGWLLFVLILPGTVNIVARQFFPVPSRVAYVTARREAENQTEKLKEAILDKFYAQHPQLTREAKEARTWRGAWTERFATLAYGQQLLDSIDRQFQAQAEAQRSFAASLQWVSPALIFQSQINQWAGTDAATYLRFQAETQVFRAKWTAYFEQKFFANQKLTVRDYAQFPRFARHRPTARLSQNH